MLRVIAVVLVLVSLAASQTITLSVTSSTSQNEGTTPGAGAVFTFLVSNDATFTAPFTVDFSISGSTNAADRSSVTSSPLTFNAPNDPQTITVSLVPDNIVEPIEVIMVTLSSSASYTISGSASASVSVMNDDSATLSVVCKAACSRAEMQSPATFTISSTNPIATPVTVDVGVTGVTATSSQDYTPFPTTLLSFDDTTQTYDLDVTIIPDAILEPDETFTVAISNLANPSGLNVVIGAQSSVIYTIQNDDPCSITLLNPATSPEGNVGSTGFVFQMTLTSPTSNPIAVDYKITDGTATIADADYEDTSGTVQFSGVLVTETRPVVVNVRGDTKGENDETFNFEIVAVHKGAITDPITTSGFPGLGTIQNDDTVTISINDASALEGTFAANTMVFTIQADYPSAVTYSVQADVVSGTAMIGSDFNVVLGTPQIFSFSGIAGETKTLTISTMPDAVAEINEGFSVILTAGAGAPSFLVLPSGPATGTIINDDSISVTVADCSVTEGGDCDFVISISKDITPAVDIYYVANSPAGTATAGTDFTMPVGDHVTLGAGVLTATVTVSTSPDTDVELDEVFYFKIGDQGVARSIRALPSTVIIADSLATGTITNDDSCSLALSIANNAVASETAAPYTVDFILTVTGTVDVAMTVEFIISGATATAGADFTDPGLIVVSIPALFSGVIPIYNVPVNDDQIVEAAVEIFTGKLQNLQSSGRAVTISQATAIARIQDDDEATITVADISKLEGSSGLTFMQFDFVLDSDVDVPFSFDYTMKEETATFLDDDVNGASGSLSFVGLQNEVRHIFVQINTDTKVEDDESFTFEFSNQVLRFRNIVLPSPPRGYILNDDSSSITIIDSSFTEGDSATNVMLIAVVCSNPVDQAFSVAYTLAPGSALQGSDYDLPISGSVSFSGAVASETKYISVNVIGDLVVEPTLESFSITLGAVTIAVTRSISVQATAGTGTIIDNDTAQISIADGAGTEGAATTMDFIISSSATLPADLTLTWTLTHITTTNSDFGAAPPITGTVTLPMLTSSVTLQIPLNDDPIIEPVQTCTVVLTPPGLPRVTISDGSALGTLTDDDGPSTITFSRTPASGAEDTVTSTVFTITLLNDVEIPVTVMFNTLDGTATTADSDYLPATGTYSLGGGSPLVHTVPVSITLDTKVENNEDFSGQLSNLNNFGQAISLAAPTSFSYTIQNDDSAQITITPVTPIRDEGNSGSTAFLWVVRMDMTTSAPVSIDYSTIDGTATQADNDYVPGSGTLIFSGTVPNDAKPIIINAVGDLVGEPNQDFTLSLGAPVTTMPAGSVTVTGTNPAPVTIRNDDFITISIADASKLEGNAGVSTLSFAVSFSGPISDPVTLEFTATPGSATDTGISSDYAFSTYQVTVPAGLSTPSLTVPVTIYGDSNVEPNEDFTITITVIGGPLPGYLTLLDDTAVGTIQNDDGISVSVSDCSVVEGGNCVFTASITADITPAITLLVTTTPGTAGLGDFTDISGNSISLGAGTLSVAIPVATTVDGDNELNENFSLTLSGVLPSTVTPADMNALGTIVNDDASTLTLTNDGPITEADSGTTVMTFTITPSHPTDVAVTVDFRTVDVTALAGTDYHAELGSYTFPAGSGAVIDIPVRIIGDTTVETLQEVFLAVLSNLQAQGRAVSFVNTASPGYIEDNDSSLVSIFDAADVEGNTGTKYIQVRVQNSAAVDTPFTVFWTTVENNNALSSDSDYIPSTGSLTFQGLALEELFIQIPVIGDFKLEPNESLEVLLTSVSTTRDVTIDGTADQAQVTIQNDDSVTLSVGDLTQLEGSLVGLQTVFAVPVTLSAPYPGLTVAWSVVAGGTTATLGASPDDYTIGPSTVTFTSNANSGAEVQYIYLYVNHDSIVEGLETIQVQLTDPALSGLTVTDADAIVRIVNDDFASFTISDLTQQEDTTPFLVPVTLSAQVDASIILDVSYSDLTTDSADDYTTVTSQLSFSGAAGEVQYISIAVAPDSIVELTETMTLAISFNTNPYPLFISISDDESLVTIVNDDSALVSIAPVVASVNEGDSGSQAYDFTVTLSAVSDTPYTIGITASDITATLFVDYSPVTPSSISVPALDPGPFTVTALVYGDTVVEFTESFRVSVTVSNTNGRQIAVGGIPATGVIVDNDVATVTLSVLASYPETDNPNTIVVQAFLDRAVDGPVRFDYTTSDGTATLGDNDYAAAAGVVAFSGTGPETKTISLSILGDTKVEANEDFVLTAFNLISAGRPVTFAGATTLTVNIIDDDQSQVSILLPVVHLEGSGVDTDYTFLVQNSNAVDLGFTVDYTTVDGTAVAGLDYSMLTGSLNFAGFAGETKSVTVVVRGDFLVEANEQFSLQLISINIVGRDVVMGNGVRQGFIINDDEATISVQDQTGNEATDLGFTVTMSNLVDEDVEIDYTILDVSTTAADWAVVSANPLVIPVGSTTGVITVSAVFDAVDEATEYFTVQITGVSTASSRAVSIADGLATGTILDQNSASIVISDCEPASATPGFVDEGSGVSTFLVTFTVRLTGAVDGGFVVDYETDDLLATSASDYNPQSGFLSFAGLNGEVKPITITVLEDQLVELDENFRVVLSNLVPNNGPRDVLIGDANGECTINNDDSCAVSINGVSLDERDAGNTIFEFTVTANHAVDVAYSVPYTISCPANVGDLFVTSGIVNFAGAANENQAIDVTVFGDVLVEADEPFTVILNSPFAAGRQVLIAPAGVGDGLIVNDDYATVSFVADVSTYENSGPMIFTLTVDKAVDGGFSVDVVTASGTAFNGLDYTAAGVIVVNFVGLAGETQPVSISLLPDAICEPPKDFTVTISAINPVLVDSSSMLISTTKPSATGTILDDDVGDPVDDLFIGEAGATLTVAAPGVLLNDPCTAGTVQLVTNVHLGVLVLNGDGSFSYDTTDCYDDVDFFTYQILFLNGQVSATAKVELVTSPCRDPYAILYVFTPITWNPLDVVSETSLKFTARDVGGNQIFSHTLNAAEVAKGYYLYKPFGSVPGSDQYFFLQLGSNNAFINVSPLQLTMLLANSRPAVNNCC